jgi:hypothetical protein
MYIYDRKLHEVESTSQQQASCSRLASRITYGLRHVTRASVRPDGINGQYVWRYVGLGQADLQAAVQQLMTQLQPLFQQSFSRNKVTYGPKVGRAVRFRIVASKDFKAEVRNEAQRLADSTMPTTLKFAPEIVQKELQRYYDVLGKPLPPRLNVINEHTQLTSNEKAAISALIEVLTVQQAIADADKIGALYSPSQGEIIFRDSQIDAGTVAHEMAHAYADQGWFDFITLMRLRGMRDVQKLDEGMTTHIERIIVRKWHTQQPSNTTIPLAGYDATFTDLALDFITQLGERGAYEGYFGGWIDFTNNAAPEDSLRIGKAQPKAWQWTWRHPVHQSKAGHLRTCGDVRTGVKLCDLKLQIRFRSTFVGFLREVQSAYEQWVTSAIVRGFIRDMTKGLKRWHQDMLNSKVMDNDPLMLAVTLNYRIKQSVWTAHATALKQWWRLIDL